VTEGPRPRVSPYLRGTASSRSSPASPVAKLWTASCTTLPRATRGPGATPPGGPASAPRLRGFERRLERLSRLENAARGDRSTPPEFERPTRVQHPGTVPGIGHVTAAPPAACTCPTARLQTRERAGATGGAKRARSRLPTDRSEPPPPRAVEGNSEAPPSEGGNWPERSLGPMFPSRTPGGVCSGHVYSPGHVCGHHDRSSLPGDGPGAGTVPRAPPYPDRERDLPRPDALAKPRGAPLDPRPRPGASDRFPRGGPR
jgi:hypothetical protein